MSERKCRDVFEDECRFEEVEKCRTMQNRKWKKTCYSGNFITVKISPPSTNHIFSGIGLIMGCGRRECYDEEDLSNNLTSTNRECEIKEVEKCVKGEGEKCQEVFPENRYYHCYHKEYRY